MIKTRIEKLMRKFEEQKKKVEENSMESEDHGSIRWES